MSVSKKKYLRNNWSYDKIRAKGTGGSSLRQTSNQIKYPFGKFNVTVNVTKNNRFIGISEIKVNKDFRSYKQKIANKGYHDVEDFYKR